jgi:hypothetical protein
MARTHARLWTTVWHDPAFLALDVPAQHTYMTLISQPGLSYAGVLTWLPSRYATLARGNTGTRVQGAVKTLERARFVVVDTKTAELLIRSYVRHDGVLDRPNMGKAVGTAINTIVSPKIRDGVTRELARYMGERPDLPGWIGLKETCPMAYEIASSMESDIALPME